MSGVNTAVVQTAVSAVQTANTISADRVELRVEVMPADYFEENTGSVLQVAAVNNYTAVMRQRDPGSVTYSIYDAKGKLCKQTPGGEAFCGWTLMNTDIVSLLRRHHAEGIALDGGPARRGLLLVSDIMSAFNIAAEHEDTVRSALAQCGESESRGRIICQLQHLSAQKDFALIPVYAALKSDPHRMHFIFDSERTVTLYNTVNEAGGPAFPEEWERSVYRKGSALNAEQAKKTPWLATLLKNAPGAPVGEGETHAVLLDGHLTVYGDEFEQNVLFNDPASCFAVTPDGSGIFYVRPNERVVRHFGAKDLKFSEITVRKGIVPASGPIVGLDFEPRGNFLLARVKEEKGAKVLLLEKGTLQIAGVLPGVNNDAPNPVQIDNRGMAYFIDSENRLRVALTDMGSYSAGALEAIRQRNAEKLAHEIKELELDAQKIDSLELPKAQSVEVRQIKPLSFETLLASLQQKIEEKVGAELAAAQTPEDLALLREKVRLLQKEPRYAKYPEAFFNVLQQLEERSASIKVDKIVQGIATLSRDLESINSPVELVQAEKKLEALLQRRRAVGIPNSKVRSALDAELRQIENRLNERDLRLRPEVEKCLAGSFATLEKAVASCQNALELGKLHQSDEMTEFEGLLQALSDEQVRGEWRRRSKVLLAGRRDAIEAQKDNEEAERKARILELLEDSAALLEEAKAAVGRISDAAALQALEKRDPFLKKIRSTLLGLPEDLRAVELGKLDKLIHERRREIEIGNRFNQMREGTAGLSSALPVYNAVERVWEAVIKPAGGGAEHGTLMFVDNLGERFIPEAGLLPLDASSSEVIEAVKRFRPEAERFFKRLGRDIPEFSDKWVINEWVEKQLLELGRLSKQQLAQGCGILILTGEAGTGKNVLVDIFAHLCSREVTTFSCNFQTEKEDLTYLFQYDPKRGTWVADSNFVRKLQVPGSVIMLDEINTLPKGVTKMLNPLLDYRRTLFLSDGRRIKADPSVIILGAMNPLHQNYQGVNQLSLEVVSRARFMPVDFPPEKDDAGRYTPYEPEVLARYLREFDGLNSEDFKALWHHVVNSEKTNEGSNLCNAARMHSLKCLHRIVKAANRIREAYISALNGDSAEPAEFVFTAREGVQIMGEIGDGIEVRQAMKNVILPKVRDAEEKTRIKTIIENV